MRNRRTYLRSVATVAATATLAGCTGNGEDGDGGGDGSGGDGGGDGSDGSGGDGSGGGNGGGDGTDGDASPTATSTATQADAASTTTAGSGSDAQSEYPDYDWGQLDDTEATATATVTMSGFAFHPLVARVSPGTTVTFPNEDSSPHTVTIPALGVDEQVSGGGETTVTVEEAGTFDYVCTFHGPSMLGRLVVEEGVTVGDGGTGGTATGEPTTDGDDGVY